MNSESVSGPRFNAFPGTFCQRCGVEAAVKDVTFRQNIGALVVRFHSSRSGQFCKSCIHAEFWRRTGITATVGWLGYISVFVAPVFILLNAYNYATAATLLAPAPNSRTADHDPAAMGRLAEIFEQFLPRFSAGESQEAVLRDLGLAARVTPGQVRVFWRSITGGGDRRRLEAVS